MLLSNQPIKWQPCNKNNHADTDKKLNVHTKSSDQDYSFSQMKLLRFGLILGFSKLLLDVLS